MIKSQKIFKRDQYNEMATYISKKLNYVFG